MTTDPTPAPSATPHPLAPAARPSARILDPVDRNSEILFGLFMVLTFTGTLSVASAGRKDVVDMLVAAIGCNLAWGFVDAVMYVLRNLVARGRQAAFGLAVRAAATPRDGQALIAGEIGPLAAGLGAAELESVRRWVLDQPWSARRSARPTARDFKGGFAVFLLVFGSTFPVVLPFVFAADLRFAMRLSGAIAIVMMFGCGYALGRHAGLSAWRAGSVMVVLGVGVESVIIALGG